METIYIRKDIHMLRKIQRRATELIPGLIYLRYGEREKNVDKQDWRHVTARIENVSWKFKASKYE